MMPRSRPTTVGQRDKKPKFTNGTLEQILEQLPEHVVITDPQGVVVFVNQAACEITGFAKEEILHRKAGSPELWGGQMSAAFYRKMWKTLAAGKLFEGELTNRRKNGQVYPAEVRISPIRDNAGDILFYVGIERDISARRKIEQMKTDFLAIVSHQLNTPLSVMKWQLELMLGKQKSTLNEQTQRLLEELYAVNEQMIQLVSSLLNITRLEAGKFKTFPQSVAFKPLLQDVIDSFSPQIANKELRLTTAISPGSRKLWVDPQLLRNVLGNLLSNACKYSRPKGHIRISISRKGKFHEIRVEDNGIGITSPDIKNLFGRFFRAEQLLDLSAEGTGIGLYFVRMITESWGGKVGVESTPKEGSCFWLTIPAKND